MATKEGDADLFSDDFNTPGWENDDPPWTPHNIPGVAGAHADQVTGSELSLGFTDTGEVLAWDGTYDAPAVYQTFEPTEGWSVEVKCTGHTLNPATAAQIWGIFAYEDDSSAPGFQLYLGGGGQDELHVWGGDALGDGVTHLDIDVSGTITDVPYFLKLTRTSGEQYAIYYKQDEIDSWTQAGSSFTYAGANPTEVHLYVGNYAVLDPHTQTFDWFYESAAGAPDVGTRRVMVVG